MKPSADELLSHFVGLQVLQSNAAAIAYFDSLDSQSQRLLIDGIEEPIINEFFNDGSLSVVTLTHVVSKWPISKKWRAVFKDRISRATNHSKTFDPYSVLGIDKNASEGEITSAYREAVKKYHPDLVATLGQDIQNLAERKTKELNNAYASIKSLRRSAA